MAKKGKKGKTKKGKTTSARSQKYTKCIVVFDNVRGMCVPYGWDLDCRGAIEGCVDRVAVFKNRAAAKQAITASRRHMRACKVLGKPHNGDFDKKNAKFVRILPLSKRWGTS